MSNKLRILWEAQDGYAGGSAPQRFVLDLDEMVEDCFDEKEAREYLEREIQSDFENKVSWSCADFDSYIEAWKDAKAKAKQR